MPEGWHRTYGVTGKFLGLGFLCPRCHLHQVIAPAEFFHCGHVEKRPIPHGPALLRFLFALWERRLPAFSLKKDGLPARVIDTWSEADVPESWQGPRPYQCEELLS